MNTNKITEVFIKDLDRLAHEIQLYPSELAMWQLEEGISNSGGNLALHILGNLQHFVGTILGGTDYVRDRPSEFSSKDVSRDEILILIKITKSVVAETIDKITAEVLESRYPQKVGFGPEDMNNLQALIILAAHLNYHLGQVNYHRRILS